MSNEYYFEIEEMDLVFGKELQEIKICFGNTNRVLNLSTAQIVGVSLKSANSGFCVRVVAAQN